MSAFGLDETVTLPAQFRGHSFIDMMHHLILTYVLHVL
jgi:hypothetical protein